jgi:plasmid stabilization system protein ParE
MVKNAANAKAIEAEYERRLRQECQRLGRTSAVGRKRPRSYIHKKTDREIGEYESKEC